MNTLNRLAVSCLTHSTKESARHCSSFSRRWKSRVFWLSTRPSAFAGVFRNNVERKNEADFLTRTRSWASPDLLIVLRTTVFALILLKLTGAASAQTLDQSFVSPGNLGADINEGFRFAAQTFSAGVTGTLGGVNIDVQSSKSSSTFPLHVAIRAVMGGVPSTTVLGETLLRSSNAPLSQLITFPQVINIVAGLQYAIVVNYEGAPPPGAGQSQGIWYGAPGDQYNGGSHCVSRLDGISWSCGDADGHFQTYMNPAPGFNVDSLVTFSPLSSTYRTMTDTSGCPAGCVGKFTFTARLTNKTTSPAMPGLNVHVQTLTNGNLLLDSRTNALLGGEGAVIPIPLVGQYADGVLTPNEAVAVPFVVCLKTRQAFQFFVDVFGVVTQLVSINRTGTDSGRAPGLTEYRGSFDPVFSANGRFVAFRSTATDLVGSGTNGLGDVFVRDLETGTTTLVTVNRTGTGSSNGTMFFPPNSFTPPIRISVDGRFVAFVSDATDLVTTDLTRGGNLFVRDLQTGTTTLVNVNQTGTGSGNADVSGFHLSADWPLCGVRKPRERSGDERHQWDFGCVRP